MSIAPLCSTGRMEVARIYTIKLRAVRAMHNYSSKQFTMSTPSGPPYQTQSPTPWIVRGDRASSSAQPPPTVRSTNHPYPVTRKDTEDLLEQIADDFYKSAATLHEESESRITFRPRHNHLSKQEVLHSLAECAYNARNYSVSGKNTYHQRALESHTKACKLNQNGIATEEMNRVQSAAFSAFAFRHNNMPESMILPANSELPKEYFDKCIQRGECNRTCTSVIIADYLANNEKTPCE